ncbi:MAG: glycoside hydrolase family 43 protein [Tannerellaceae bacterium]|nr:glycoside hydrolase family 43 protein [Tannerellaceae bacterium]
MMNLFKSLIFCLSLLLAGCQENNKEKQDPGQPPASTAKQIALADPYILLYNNTYYAYGTNSPDGIEVYTSGDLVNWKKHPDLALHKDNSWGDRWFWAPEVYYIPSENKFYMYYSVDEHISVATAGSPLGPFTQEVRQPIIPDEKGIDNSLFIDEDGKAYISFVRFDNGNNIWVAELEPGLKSIKKNTLTCCIKAEEPWEKELGTVTEGSFIIKHKGIYYMIYSANDFHSPNYGVGYATASSPLGPWNKYPGNPVFQQPDTLVGVGHSAIFTDREGNMKMVFHAHNSRQQLHPRLMYITDVTFTNEAIPVMHIGGNIIAAIEASN